MQFFLPMDNIPKGTHQMKQVNFKSRTIYDAESVQQARKLYMNRLLPLIPEKPLEGALRLVTKWCYPIGDHQQGTYKTTRPDTDNLIKLFKDCLMAAGFFYDDAQIASEITEKFWAEPCGIYVELYGLEETPTEKPQERAHGV